MGRSIRDADKPLKMFSTEGGIRVPFMAKYLGKSESGKSSKKFAFVKDIVPTMLEIAGVDNSGTSYNGKKINSPDWKSMWSALAGKASKVQADGESIGYERAGSSAVFRGKYKLVQNLPPEGTGKWELYDIEADPLEAHNIAKQKPMLAANLLKAYEAYAKANNVVPVPEGYSPFEQAIKNSKLDGGY